MMRIPKKVRDMPWPEPFTGNDTMNFRVAVQQPVVEGQRLLVVTFTMNEVKRGKSPWCSASWKDFRLVCSKKYQTAAVTLRGDRAYKRRSPSDTMYAAMATRPGSCYPEINPADEAILTRWLGTKGETSNHHLPELALWVEETVAVEEKAEKLARGEILDDDVTLCPRELPEGLVDYIQRVVLEEDRVILYEKGGWRGTCFCCRQKVRAPSASERFAQGRIGYCPECGMRVQNILKGGAMFAADTVENVVTLQRGREDGVLFLREWRLERDPTAQWQNIPHWLKETARWMLRGSRVAKWQHEEKYKVSMMRSERFSLDDWTRVNSVTDVYDGAYYFYLPDDWKMQVVGTPLEYCPLEDFSAVEERRRKCKADILRVIVDWPRYPAVEKFYKAGYVPLIEQRGIGVGKELRYAVKWQADSIAGALWFPQRLLKLLAPAEWSMERMKLVGDLWALVKNGGLRETEIEPFLESGMQFNMVAAALGHAPVPRISSWLERQREMERERFDREEQERRKGVTYYSRTFRSHAEETYRDYLADCVALGLDLDDRAVLLPKDLDAAHRRTIQMVKHKANEAKRPAFHKRAEKLQKWRYEASGLLIRPASDADELIAEGAALHHCVGGYADRMADGETAIFFIRRLDEPDVPYYTLELVNRRVIQCRTRHNESYEQNPTVLDFVNEWLREIVGGKKKHKEDVA